MHREKLYEHLNVLDGNIGYICMSDDVFGVLGLLWGSYRALFGVFICSIQRIREERKAETKI